MAVELIRIDGGKAAIVDTLLNCESITCDQCDQAYEFRRVPHPSVLEGCAFG